MELDLEELDRRDAYRWLTSLVVPRPIAWITTASPEGLVNLAPFSFFQAVQARPPILMVSVSKRGKERKDTARNIFETGELVVHLATEADAEAVNGSSADFPADVSEVERLGLETTPSTIVRPPRLVSAPIALECRLHRAIEDDVLTTTLFLVRVLRVHVRDDVIGDDGLIDARKVRPLTRLGGELYAGIGSVFPLVRPEIDRKSGAPRAAPGGTAS